MDRPVNGLDTLLTIAGAASLQAATFNNPRRERNALRNPLLLSDIFLHQKSGFLPHLPAMIVDTGKRRGDQGAGIASVHRNDMYILSNGNVRLAERFDHTDANGIGSGKDCLGNRVLGPVSTPSWSDTRHQNQSRHIQGTP